VQKTTSSGAVSYLYDLGGHPITEIGSNGVWNRGEVYAAGRHLATYANSTTYFIHADWLGTERARSDVTGGLCETIGSLPFGDGQSTSGSCSDISTMHFTGKPRDTESNLDYFGARYYGSNLGRFMTPDWADKPTAVPYAMFGDPQTLNLYAYVRNNPLSKADPDGHCEPGCSDLIARVVVAVTMFSVRHPEVGKAYDKMVSSLSLKVSGGAQLKTPEKLAPVSGGVAATGYVKLSGEGVSAGANASASSSLGGVGMKSSLDLPIAKNNELVNPLKSASGEVSSTAGSGKDNVDVEASGNDKGEASFGGTYGEGLAFGVEVGADVGELGAAILDGIISDIKDNVEQLKQGLSLFSIGTHDTGDNTKPQVPRPQ